jgi:hypothetical protein
VQRYPVRSNHRANLKAEALESLCRTHFESAQREEDAVVASYGAIAHLKVWADGRELAIDVSMNSKVDPPVAAETIRRYNRFLEETTGFTSKERARRLKKSATAGTPGE